MRNSLTLILILTTVLIPSKGLAQNHRNDSIVNKDSLYQKGQKNFADTTNTFIHFQNNSAIPTSKYSQKPNINPGILKWSKYDAFKEKIKNLQIANTIRSHISR